MSRQYWVTVKVRKCAPVLSDPDDRESNPRGDYRYEVVANSLAKAEEKGLDEFHSSVAIGCLEDFEITAHALAFPRRTNE